jgi:hypothetical protein
MIAIFVQAARLPGRGPDPLESVEAAYDQVAGLIQRWIDGWRLPAGPSSELSAGELVGPFRDDRCQ